MHSPKKMTLLPLFAIAFAMGICSDNVNAKKMTQENSDNVLIKTVPTFYIKTDGKDYTGLSEQKHTIPNWQIAARFTFSAPGNEVIKSYNLQLRLKHNINGQEEKFYGSKVSKSYSSGNRPRSIDKDVAFALNSSEIEGFLVNACNAQANSLRQQGQGNRTIFSENHTLDTLIYASHAVDIQQVPFAGFSSQFGGYEDKYANIVCMKAPSPTVDTANNFQGTSGVTSASLNIIEQSTLGGSCKVNLATVIQTNTPNTEVRYRFEHTNGKKSNIKTVTTSHTNTAMDAHWYDVPFNPNGAEAGNIRIIGVSHNFQSEWKQYNMTCNEPTTNTLLSVSKPIANLTLEATNKILYKGMLCPTKIKITTKLTSKKAFEGNGIIQVKQGYTGFSERDVSLRANVPKTYYETLNLRPWNTINATDGLAGGSNTFHTQASNSNGTTLSQHFEIRYSLTANQQSVLLTPYKSITVSCSTPKVNQSLQPNNQRLNSTTRSPITQGQQQQPNLQFRQNTNQDKRQK